jgi:hypothetical protein
MSLHFDCAGVEHDVTKANATWHSILRVQNVASGASTRFAMNTRSMLYVPTCVFVALVFASSLWRLPRGPRALAIGAGVLAGFLTFSVVLPILRLLGTDRIAAIDMGEGTARYLDAAFSAWIVPPAMTYAVPGLIWLAAIWLCQQPTKAAAN